MSKKEHLNIEGLNKVIKIKSALNKGLTPLLTQNFPNITLMERPTRKFSFSKINPYWITGFVEAVSQRDRDVFL